METNKPTDPAKGNRVEHPSPDVGRQGQDEPVRAEPAPPKSKEAERTRQDLDQPLP
jgi:hypothetical protein